MQGSFARNIALWLEYRPPFIECKALLAKRRAFRLECRALSIEYRDLLVKNNIGPFEGSVGRM